MKKILSLLLCLVLMLGVAACGGKGDNDANKVTELLSRDEANEQGLIAGKTLKIHSMNMGYGTKGLEEIAKAYIEDENPTATIEVIPDGNIETTFTDNITVESSDIDMYFCGGVDFPMYYYDLHNTQYLLDLTDFYNSWTTTDGENIKDVLAKDLVDMLSIPDFDHPDQLKRQFTLPWAGGGTGGFVYNTELFEEVGVDIPTTTDEMFDCFDKFLNYNEAHKDETGFLPIVPVIYGGGDAIKYWSFFLTYTWWAQYEGYDKFMQYWTLTDNGNAYEPKKLYRQNGQLEALKVLEKILKGSGYTYRSSKGLTAAQAEKYFVSDVGDETRRYAMTPNGDWFEQEAKAATGTDVPGKFKMMDTPFLSSAPEANKSVKIASSLGTTHNVVISSYSANKYLALDFLRYYYSQKGALLYTKYAKSLLPRKDFTFFEEADLDAMSPFIRSEIELMNIGTRRYVAEAEYLSPIRFSGGMTIIPSGGFSPEQMMIGDTPTTAQSIFDEYNNHFDSKWQSYYDNVFGEE